ncbi:hypothetical protein L195_g062228, partial [Trifolium pratense]
MELGGGDVKNLQHLRLKGSKGQPDVEWLDHVGVKVKIIGRGVIFSKYELVLSDGFGYNRIFIRGVRKLDGFPKASHHFRT